MWLPRRWLQFRLWHLGVVVTLAAAVLAWIAEQRRQAAREAAALHTLQMMGAVYDGHPYHVWLAGRRVQRGLSVRLVDLGRVDTWGPYGPDQRLVKLHDWDARHFDEVGSALQHLSGLQSLSFKGSRLPGNADRLVPHSRSLEYLNLEQTGIRASELQVLKRVPNLSRLSLRRTATDDAALQHVGRLSRLVLLDLSSTNVTDDGMPSIAGLANLRLLRLENTQLTDAGLRHLASLRQLQELDLGLTFVTAESQALLVGLDVRQRLVVPHEWSREDEARLQRALPNCEVSRSPYAIGLRSSTRTPAPSSP